MSRPARYVPAYTYDEYRRFEDANPAKHEFVDGHILGMAGGTPAHARLQAAILFVLEQRLEGSPCQPFPSDLRVRVRETGMATYPDVTVVCGTIDSDPEDPHAIVNPTVIVEVTSDRTERYDHGEKFAHYRKIPSLREYVLVSHRERHLEVRRRAGDATWTEVHARRGEAVRFDALGIDVAVDEIYERSELTREL